MSEVNNSAEATARSLLDQQAEGRSLDYKAAAAFAGDFKYKLIRCLIAFANTPDGGSLLIGVKEQGTAFVLDGLSPEQAETFEVTKIGQPLREHCTEAPTVSVHHATLDGNNVVHIRVEEFQNEPIICAKSRNGSNNKEILRAGAVYVRTDDAQCIQPRTASEMRAVIQMAVRKQGGTLLSQVRALIAGVPAPVVDGSGEFTHQLDAASYFIDQVAQGQAHYSLIVRPVNFEEERLTRNQLRQAVQQAQVAIRGWYVPHIDRESDKNTQEGIENRTTHGRYVEGYEAVQSGLFVWARVLWEDLDDNFNQGPPLLSFDGAIWSATEHVLLALRLAEGLYPDESVHVEWNVVGLTGRRLWAEPMISLSPNYVSGGETVHRSLTTTVAELSETWKDVARDWAGELLELFGLDLDPGVLADWQDKFLEKRF